MRHTIVLATNNRKKSHEMAELFRVLNIEIKALSDFEQTADVLEDGTSFAENAAKKAREQAINLNHWVIAEDSGISVDALNGEPGIYSARFSGEGATDEKNNLLLLKKLENVPLQLRTAYYSCHFAVADPLGEIRATCESRCKGRIRFEPSGCNGFGYDPLFEIVEYHRTFGELSPEMKRLISHRSRAARLLIPALNGLLLD